MSKEISYGVPESKAKAIIQCIVDAKNPLIIYNADQDDMRQQADDIREEKLKQVLGILKELGWY